MTTRPPAPEPTRDAAADAPLDPWALLRSRTVARIGLARAGSSIATADHLAFEAAHAGARDAVKGRLDLAALAADLEARGLTPLPLACQAPDRATHLARPDLGRRLDPDAAPTIARTDPDVMIALIGGLSAAGIAAHGPTLAAELAADFRALGLTVGPVPIVDLGRVALGDEIAERMGARLAIVLVGERPGLSSADAVGAYLTFAPRPGRNDAERNCVSNIRPAGMSLAEARRRIVWLATEALRLALTGTGLKDRSDEGQLPPPADPMRIS